MDVPSSAAGTITKLHVNKGSRVNAGDVVATLKGAAAASAAERPADLAPAPAPTPARGRHRSGPDARRDGPRGIAGRGICGRRTARHSQCAREPVGARFARELGVDLARVQGQRRARAASARMTSRPSSRMCSRRPSRAEAARRRAATGPGSRLRGLRAGRGQAARTHPEDLRSAAAGGVGQHPARHAVSTKRTSPSSRNSARRSRSEACEPRRQADAARLHRRGPASRRCASSRCSTASLDAVGPEPRVQEVPAPRLRGRHAERAGGAGDPRCRPQGRLRACARRSGSCRRRPARAS